MDKRIFILLQVLIFFFPASIMTMVAQVNEYITSAIQEFTAYRCGLSGFFVMVALDEFFNNMTVAAALTSSLYLLILVILANWLYKKNERNLKFSLWNIGIGFLGVTSGHICMVLAMQ